MDQATPSNPNPIAPPPYSEPARYIITLNFQPGVFPDSTHPIQQRGNQLEQNAQTLDHILIESKPPPWGCILALSIVGIFCCFICGLASFILALVGKFTDDQEYIQKAFDFGLISLFFGLIWIVVVIIIIAAYARKVLETRFILYNVSFFFFL